MKQKSNKLLIIINTLACLLIAQTIAVNNSFANLDIEGVAALGRIEPKKGIRTIGVPSSPEATAGSLIAKLYVEEGDLIEKGQLLAETGSAELARKRLAEAEQQLALAEGQYAAQLSHSNATCVGAQTASNEAKRRKELRSKGLAADEEAELAEAEAQSANAFCDASRIEANASKLNIEVVKARIETLNAQLQRKLIYAPVSGLVLQINSHEGEFASQYGLLELADISQMFAVAEVYETDISRIRLGQKAIVSSDALATDLSGKVTFISPKVQKHDAIGMDPAAKKDARIVEVDVLLDSPEFVQKLTNLQVEIVFE